MSNSLWTRIKLYKCSPGPREPAEVWQTPGSTRHLWISFETYSGTFGTHTVLMACIFAVCSCSWYRLRDSCLCSDFLETGKIYWRKHWRKFYGQWLYAPVLWGPALSSYIKFYLSKCWVTSPFCSSTLSKLISPTLKCLDHHPSARTSGFSPLYVEVLFLE